MFLVSARSGKHTQRQLNVMDMLRPSLHTRCSTRAVAAQNCELHRCDDVTEVIVHQRCSKFYF